jgi:hypothetical protein
MVIANTRQYQGHRILRRIGRNSRSRRRRHRPRGRRVSRRPIPRERHSNRF